MFEPLLDELLALFSPDWVLPERMVGKHQHHRCGEKTPGDRPSGVVRPLVNAL
ncbi:hypothetical protein [Streptomyces mirabilis]|uniref:hypothetical protein n=1 Tax=Streptomyces mirabilis TaxID=68239 RepID=UPI00364EAC29